MTVSTHAIPFCGPRGGAVRAEEEVAIWKGKRDEKGGEKEEKCVPVLHSQPPSLSFYITPSKDLPATTAAFFLLAAAAAAGLLYSYFLATTPTKNRKLTAEIPASIR